MRPLRLARTPWYQPVGEGGRQEFVAGAIPLRAVIALEDAPLVLVQHRRGFLRAFDEHLDAVREHVVRAERIDYQVTWLGMTDGEEWPPLVRLELRLDGLARPPAAAVRAGHARAAVAARKRGAVRAACWIRRATGWSAGPVPTFGCLEEPRWPGPAARADPRRGSASPHRPGCCATGADCGGVPAQPGCAIPAPERADPVRETQRSRWWRAAAIA